MASLYEMTNDVMMLQDMLESGEIDDQTYHDSVESMMIDGKIENICKMMRHLDLMAESYKAEIDRLTARKKTVENSSKRLKDSLLHYMMSTDAKKVDAGLFSVSLSKSTSVEVWDEKMLPEEYLIPQPAKVDKAAISKALKAGEPVDGAQLVEKPYVRVR